MDNFLDRLRGEHPIDLIAEAGSSSDNSGETDSDPEPTMGSLGSGPASGEEDDLDY